MSMDILFENARIIDGTGSPWFRGAVGVQDGRITSVSRSGSPEMVAETMVDLQELVIAPGFVDTHSHSDLELFTDNYVEPKVRQGITTEVLGQDGFSMGPIESDDSADELRQHLGGLTGAPEKEWTWGSLGEYFEAIESADIAPNMASLVGHGTVRYNVLGMADRQPTEEELGEMADLVTESLEQGAIGFSTGLIYAPCSYAETGEVAELASRLKPFGRPFVAHIRSEGRWIWEALDEFIDIGYEESVPVHISHFKVAGPEQHGKAQRAIECVEMARERGIDMTAEQYPYTAGSTMLSTVLPPWVHAAGHEEAVSYLDNPEDRERIKRDIRDWRIDGWENVGALAGWNNIVISSVETAKNQDLIGSSIADIAAARDIDPVELVCDLLVEEEMTVSTVIHQLTEEDVREIMACERVNIATDGLFGGNPHPRVYGTYPRILGHYVRDENLFTLEEAVRKMTSLPARVLGLQSKGLIREGMDADLVVFNPNTVDTRASFEDPKQYPEGIEHVLINGEWVIRNSETTGNAPGEVIRS